MVGIKHLSLMIAALTSAMATGPVPEANAPRGPAIERTSWRVRGNRGARRRFSGAWNPWGQTAAQAQRHIDAAAVKRTRKRLARLELAWGGR